MEGFELIKQGAEARLFKGTYLGKATIAKQRFVKKYRHPDLDAHLTRERIKSEARAIVRCKTVGIRTPTLYLVDFARRTIYMEYFADSVTVKEYIPGADSAAIDRLSGRIGRVLGRMHAGNIIHGDLTTSNMLLVGGKNSADDLELIFIDFGLAHVESSAEDKGVDLYVLERALLSTHSGCERMFERILEGYREGYSTNSKSSGFKEVLHKYEEVRARGRKRTMVG